VFIFYWMQLHSAAANPLVSRKEASTIDKQRYNAMMNVLEILHSYVVHRSREFSNLVPNLGNNMVVVKLLNEFYDYAKDSIGRGDREGRLIEMCQRSHEKLSEQLRYEVRIKNRVEDGKGTILL
jgi:hypothetical protein